jgi:hypothetical protein
MTQVTQSLLDEFESPARRRPGGISWRNCVAERRSHPMICPKTTTWSRPRIVFSSNSIAKVNGV